MAQSEEGITIAMIRVTPAGAIHSDANCVKCGGNGFVGSKSKGIKTRQCVLCNPKGRIYTANPKCKECWDCRFVESGLNEFEQCGKCNAGGRKLKDPAGKYQPIHPMVLAELQSLRLRREDVKVVKRVLKRTPRTRRWARRWRRTPTRVPNPTPTTPSPIPIDMALLKRVDHDMRYYYNLGVHPDLLFKVVSIVHNADWWEYATGERESVINTLSLLLTGMPWPVGCSTKRYCKEWKRQWEIAVNSLMTNTVWELGKVNGVDKTGRKLHAVQWTNFTIPSHKGHYSSRTRNHNQNARVRFLGRG